MSHLVSHRCIPLLQLVLECKISLSLSLQHKDWILIIWYMCVDSTFDSILKQWINIYPSSLGLENLGFHLGYKLFMLYREEQWRTMVDLGLPSLFLHRIVMCEKHKLSFVNNSRLIGNINRLLGAKLGIEHLRVNWGTWLIDHKLIALK